MPENIKSSPVIMWQNHTHSTQTVMCQFKTCLKVVPEAKWKVTAALVDRIIARHGRTLLQYIDISVVHNTINALTVPSYLCMCVQSLLAITHSEA